MNDENAAKIIEQLALIASHLQARGDALESIDRKLAASAAADNGHSAMHPARLKGASRRRKFKSS